MATLRKVVSDVRAMHKLLSTDNLITDRAVASEIRNNTLLLVKRETNLRKLWATDTVFTTIPCLEMVEVPISECCEYVEIGMITPRIFIFHWKQCCKLSWFNCISMIKHQC